MDNMYQDMMENAEEEEERGISEPQTNASEPTKPHKILPHLAERREYAAIQNTEEQVNDTNKKQESPKQCIIQ